MSVMLMLTMAVLLRGGEPWSRARMVRKYSRDSSWSSGSATLSTPGGNSQNQSYLSYFHLYFIFVFFCPRPLENILVCFA